MTAYGVTYVATESTGACLKTDLQHPGEPLHHAVGECPTPEASAGGKSDVRDCQWIAQLLPYELRDLTRHRDKGRGTHRKPDSQGLQDTNIKLSSVATDVLGTFGRAIGSIDQGGRGSGEAREAGIKRPLWMNNG